MQSDKAAKALGVTKNELKFIFVVLAIALVQIAQLNAQSVSPAGHYTKKRDGAGEMRVEKTDEGWRVFVTAGGIPRGGATAADCTLITVGEIKGNTFQGEIKYQPAPDEKPGPDNAVESGHKMTIAFAPEFATLTAADVGFLCGNGKASSAATRRTEDNNGPQFGSADLPKTGTYSMLVSKSVRLATLCGPI